MGAFLIILAVIWIPIGIIITGTIKSDGPVKKKSKKKAKKVSDSGLENVNYEDVMDTGDKPLVLFASSGAALVNSSAYDLKVDEIDRVSLNLSSLGGEVLENRSKTERESINREPKSKKADDDPFAVFDDGADNFFNDGNEDIEDVSDEI